MNRSSILPALALLLCTGATAAAQPQVDARLDTTGISIGDPVTLTLSAHTGPGETVRFPDLQPAPDKFELIGAGAPERYEEGNGSSLERRSFKLTSFETGQLELPPLPFVVMEPDGSVDTVYTRALSLEVISLLQDTTKADVRPLKPLIEVPPRWHRLALLAVAALMLLGGLIWLWLRYLKRRDRRLSGAPVEAAPKRPAHVVAVEELDRIKALGLIEKGEIKMFHSLISDAIRRYIQDLYEIEAIDMTTWEVYESLHRALLAGPDIADRFQEFLQACDLVKFAKYRPPIVEINSIFNQAYDLVESTRRLPTAEPVEETAPAAGTDSVEPASPEAMK